MDNYAWGYFPEYRGVVHLVSGNRVDDGFIWSSFTLCRHVQTVSGWLVYSEPQLVTCLWCSAAALHVQLKRLGANAWEPTDAVRRTLVYKKP